MNYNNLDYLFKPSREDLKRTLKQDVRSFDNLCNDFNKRFNNENKDRQTS